MVRVNIIGFKCYYLLYGFAENGVIFFVVLHAYVAMYQYQMNILLYKIDYEYVNDGYTALCARCLHSAS